MTPDIPAHAFLDEATGCWLWVGSKTMHGYPTVWEDGRTTLAHRTMYERHIGPIKPGREVHHRCGNRRCVNPAHLIQLKPGQHDRAHPDQAVTLRANAKRGRKLSVKQARKLRRKWLAGASQAELVRESGLSASTVNAIVHGRAYV